MKTDKLFHEYFSLVPQAFFELLGAEPGCEYSFSSPVVKETERQLDGLLEPAEPGFPYYFLEVQGYIDPVIYWRAIQQLGLYFTSRPDLRGVPWQIVIIFLDPAFDPGLDSLGPMYTAGTPWLTRANLSDLLENVTHSSAVLNVLRPLIVDEQRLRRDGIEWSRRLKQDQSLDIATRNRLVDLLAQFVITRFGNLSRKEIEQMLMLTPLEETRAGQELIAIGREDGMEEGVARTILRVVERRFRAIPAGLAADLDDLPVETLEMLFDEALDADTLTQFHQAVREAHNRE